MTDINIRVDGPTLSKLISEDAKLKIDAMAAEKVAEEILRKISRGNLDGKIQAAIKRVEIGAEKIQEATLSALKHKWTFPREAHDVIREVTREWLTNENRSVGAKITKEITAEVNKVFDAHEAKMIARLNTWWNGRSDKLKETVRAQARAEFLDVIREAKEATR